MPIAIRNLVAREAPARYRVAPHAHQVTQLYYCHSGALVVTVGDREHELLAGEGLLIRPGAQRACASGEPAPVYLFALFEDRGLDLAAAHHRLWCPDDTLRPDLEALMRESLSVGGSDSEALCTALLVRLLIGLRRQMVATQPPRHHGQASLVARVDAVMKRNLHRPLTREQLAEALCISPAHLARLYRAGTGSSLHRRLHELRVAQACLLLRDSTLAVERIARDVGYRSPSHFTKAFKSSLGLTPSAYRRAVQQ
ncbi:MAG: helix-turn-helix domain-containing protein [Planctomycetota bacterium]